MGRKDRRKKYINRAKKSEAKRQSQARTALTAFLIVLVLIIAVVVVSFVLQGNGRDAADEETIALYNKKSSLLFDEISSGKRDSELSEIVMKDVPEKVVFISVSDGDNRAKVFTGKGEDLTSAWKDADAQALAYVTKSGDTPLWVKADLMSSAKRYSSDSFSKELHHWRHEFFRSGIAFDQDFDTALLEAELNGAKILDYEEECIDFAYLNNYLKKSGRDQLNKLPNSYILFDCISWFCDENSEVYDLISDNADYGRRKVDTIDKEYASMLVKNASGFLVDQVNRDGSFIYGLYPRFDNEIENYNIVRHASTLWSLVCQYRMTENEDLIPIIEKCIDYMIDKGIVYSDKQTAYLYEKKSDEIKLGGCGVAVIALTEYMDAFGSDKYEDIAVKLGNGILTMFDDKTGEYYHVLNGNYSRKEEFRTVYYDGEATFALCRLYSLTKDQRWLDAAMTAVDHFIAADYVQFKDHWIAYSLNEITKYVTDNDDYYTFALRNANENLETIHDRDTTFHTYLELLMSTFEIYDRMITNNIHNDYLENVFDVEYFLNTIYKRADHQLNGYFYPEYAMYMGNPNRILNTFMVRHDGYRVRIDDVQHNVGGYYLYYLDYDKLVDYGMLNYRD